MTAPRRQPTPPPLGMTEAEVAELKELDEIAGRLRAALWHWPVLRDLLAAPHSGRSERLVYRLPTGSRRALAGVIADITRLREPTPAPTPAAPDRAAAVRAAAAVLRDCGLPLAPDIVDRLAAAVVAVLDRPNDRPHVAAAGRNPPGAGVVSTPEGPGGSAALSAGQGPS